MIRNCTKKTTICIRKNSNHGKNKLRSNWITKRKIISCNKEEILYTILKKEPNNKKSEIIIRGR